MENEPEPVISFESFDKYEPNERCRVSRQRVQDFVDRGLASQDTIYRRYTEVLSERLSSARRFKQPDVIKDIKASFQRLRNPATGHFSPELFKQQITQYLLPLSIPLAEDSSTTLLSILSFHAFHPFPLPNYHSRAQPLIDEDAFVRAICLLILSPFPFQGPDSPATHGYYSGTWGPHRGGYVARRGKDANDFRRRIFRSIAIPSGTRSEHTTTVTIPRFEYYQPIPGGGEDDLGIETIVIEEEKEVEVDIVDVISECPPEEDRLTANSFRESYRVALPSLPQHTEDLVNLCVPTARLVGLIGVVRGLQDGSTAEWAAMLGRLGSEERIGWRGFDAAMAEHSKYIADGLSTVFETFTFAST